MRQNTNNNQGTSNQGTSKPIKPIKLPYNWRKMTKQQLELELITKGERLNNKKYEYLYVYDLVQPKVMVKYVGEAEFVELKVVEQEDMPIIMD